MLQCSFWPEKLSGWLRWCARAGCPRRPSRHNLLLWLVTMLPVWATVFFNHFGMPLNQVKKITICDFVFQFLSLISDSLQIWANDIAPLILLSWQKHDYQSPYTSSSTVVFLNSCLKDNPELWLSLTSWRMQKQNLLSYLVTWILKASDLKDYL